VLSEPAGRRLQKGTPFPADLILKIIPAEPPAAPAAKLTDAYRLFSPEGRFLALAKLLEDQNAFLPFIVL
jgi:hypothetical protein